MYKRQDLVRDAYVFHAGTRNKNDTLVTDGGRVLSVTGIGKDLESAIASAYRAADTISFEGRYRRDDIGKDLVKEPSQRATAAVKH